jgi:NAD(P)-dependent dehydrogenase (short-subunit alcohol dehydrogenase family)
MSDQEWHDVLDTNLSGAFYVCRFFLSTFLAYRAGRFV